MNPEERNRRWKTALSYYRSARLNYWLRMYNTSINRSYYTVYLAMWAALGDPPQRRWKHIGIIKVFSIGGWRDSKQPVERRIKKAIETLYDYRIEVDYKAFGCS